MDGSVLFWWRVARVVELGKLVAHRINRLDRLSPSRTRVRLSPTGLCRTRKHDIPNVMSSRCNGKRSAFSGGKKRNKTHRQWVRGLCPVAQMTWTCPELSLWAVLGVPSLVFQKLRRHLHRRIAKTRRPSESWRQWHWWTPCRQPRFEEGAERYYWRCWWRSGGAQRGGQGQQCSWGYLGVPFCLRRSWTLCVGRSLLLGGPRDLESTQRNQFGSRYLVGVHWWFQ